MPLQAQQQERVTHVEHIHAPTPSLLDEIVKQSTPTTLALVDQIVDLTSRVNQELAAHRRMAAKPKQVVTTKPWVCANCGSRARSKSSVCRPVRVGA